HGYQVTNGELAQLGDRRVEFLQRVPEDTPASDIQGHVAGAYAVVGSLHAWRAVDVNGNVIAAFVPTPGAERPTSHRGRAFVTIRPISIGIAPRLSSVVFRVERQRVSGDVIKDDGEFTHELWLFDGRGRSETRRIRTLPAAPEATPAQLWPYRQDPEVTRAKLRPYRHDADRAFVLWADGGEVHRLALDSLRE